MNLSIRLPIKEIKEDKLHKRNGKNQVLAQSIRSDQGIRFEKGEIVFSKGETWSPWPAVILKVKPNNVSQIKFFNSNMSCWSEPQDLIAFTSENIEMFQKRYQQSNEKEAGRILKGINAAIHAKEREQANRDKSKRGRKKSSRFSRMSNQSQNQSSCQYQEQKVQTTENVEIIEIHSSIDKKEDQKSHIYVRGKILNYMYEYQTSQLDNSYDDQHLREDQIYKLLKGVPYQKALILSKPFQEQKKLFSKILSSLMTFLKTGLEPKPTPKYRQMLLALLRCKKFNTEQLIAQGFANSIIRFVLDYESSPTEIKKQCRIEYMALRSKSNIFSVILSGKQEDLFQMLSVYRRRRIE